MARLNVNVKNICELLNPLKRRQPYDESHFAPLATVNVRAFVVLCERPETSSEASALRKIFRFKSQPENSRQCRKLATAQRRDTITATRF